MTWYNQKLRGAEEASASGPGDFGLLALEEEEKGLHSAVETVAKQESARSTAQAELNALETEKSQLLKFIGTLEERIAGYESLRASRDDVTLKAVEFAGDAVDWQLLALCLWTGWSAEPRVRRCGPRVGT